MTVITSGRIRPSRVWNGTAALWLCAGLSLGVQACADKPTTPEMGEPAQAPPAPIMVGPTGIVEELKRQDTDGEAAAGSSNHVSFKDGVRTYPGPLEVLFAGPEGEQVRTTNGTIIFNHPMVPLSVVDTDAEVDFVTVKPPLPLRFRWKGTKVLDFGFQSPPPAATEYQITVQPGSRGVNGAALEAPYTFSFKTRHQRVSKVLPRGEQVRPGARIEVTFELPVHRPSLKDRLAIFERNDRRLPFSTSFLDDRTVVLKPLSPLPREANIFVQVQEGVTAKEGPLPTIEDTLHSFSIYGPMAVRDVFCEAPCGERDSKRIVFSNPTGGDSMETDKIQIQPPLPNREIYCSWKSCYVHGAFKPDTEYTFRFPPTLCDIYEQCLGSWASFSLMTGPPAPVIITPSLTVAVNGEIFERKQRSPMVRLRTEHVDSLQVAVATIEPETLLASLDRFSESRWRDEALDHQPLPTSLSPVPQESLRRVPAPPGDRSPSEAQSWTLDLAALMGGESRGGAVILDVSSPEYINDDGNKKHLKKIFRFTDLHISTLKSSDKLLYWVTSFDSGEPVEGARVEFHHAGKGRLWTGTTDEGGLVEMPWSKGFDPVKDMNNATAVIAIKDNDWTYETETDRPWEGESTRSFLFTDKDLYRPGQTVHVKGIIRAVERGALALPESGLEVSWAINNPNYDPILSGKSTLSSLGTFNVDFQLPEDAMYGEWDFQVNGDEISAQTGFQLAVYRPARIEGELEVKTKHVIQGQSTEGSVLGRWFGGGPLRGGKATLSFYGSTSRYSPPGWAGYTFGKNHWSHDGSSAAPFLHHQEEKELDDRGEAGFKVTLDPGVPKTYRVNVEAMISDPSDQRVSLQDSFWLHSSNHSLGIELDRYLVSANSTIEPSFVTVGHEGDAIAGVSVEASVVRREWKTIRRQELDGTFGWETTHEDHPVGTCSIKSGAQGVSCPFTPAEVGTHVITAHSRDQNGNVSEASRTFYVTSNTGYANWDREQISLLEPDRSNYEVGEVARVMVKNPYPGAQAVVTQNRDGILKARVIRLEGSTPVLEIPIEEHHRPNFYLSVNLFRGRLSGEAHSGKDTGAPSTTSGTVELSVDTSKERLKVDVVPNKTTYSPAQTVTVDVNVRDHQDRAVPAEITLYAVDEGVLSLSGYTTPDPFDTFHRSHHKGVSASDQMWAMATHPVLEDKGEEGGGGGEEASAPVSSRKNFKDVAYYAGTLRTDGDGHAQGSFELPDNLTTYRLMAVAVSGVERFGSADTRIDITKPVVLLPNLPHFAEVDDLFEANVTIRNTTREAFKARVSLSLSNPDGSESSSSIASKPQQDIHLGPGASSEVVFQVLAKKTGATNFKWEATTRSYRDEVEKTLEVKDRRHLESMAAYGVIQGREGELSTVQESLADPQDVVSSLGSLSVWVSSSGMGQLRAGIDYLETYPYGCAEQRSSRLLGWLYDDMLRRWRVGSDQADSRDVKEQIASVLELQSPTWNKPHGSFSLWEGGRAHVQATAYALLTLKEAEEAGYPIPETALSDGAEFLLNTLKGGEYGIRRVEDPVDRAMVMAALGALGEPALDYLEQAVEAEADLSLNGTLWLAEAMERSGPDTREEAERLLREILGRAQVESDLAWIPAAEFDGHRAWASEVRDNAMVLNLLTRLLPEHTLGPRIARWLTMQRKRGHWGSTQDNAYALRGLSGHFRAVEAEAPDLMFGAVFGQKPLLEGRVASRTTERQTGLLPMSELTGGGAVRLGTRGPGTLYYGMRYEYAPLKPTPKEAGFLLSRQVLPLNESADPQSLQRGDSAVVVLQVTSATNYDYVALVDPLPAGWEVVDFQQATSSNFLQTQVDRLLEDRGVWSSSNDDDYDDYDDYDYGYEEHGSHQEATPTEVRFFLDHLSPGTRTFTYVVRAATRGQFRSPAPKVEAMYRPEIFATGVQTQVAVQ